MARRSGFQKKIDSVHWISGQSSFAALGAGTVAATLANAQHLPETLMRIRGEWAAVPAAAGAPGRSALITCGIVLVPEGTGTTVLWSPFTDSDAPWIWWGTAYVAHEEVVVDVIACQEVLSFRREIDNKAMRRVRNQEVQVVLENTTIATALAVDVRIHVRMLAGQS